MFENEIVINQALLDQFKAVAADLPADRHFLPHAGHGHSPAWVMGHLALVGEMGCSMLGGQLTHRGWLPLFAPGSPPVVDAAADLGAETLAPALEAAYAQLQTLAPQAPAELLSQPHEVQVLKNSRIQTVGQIISLLLTNHFGFHLSQLSSCRREAGLGPLF